jgi:hypothetical protein
VPSFAALRIGIAKAGKDDRPVADALRLGRMASGVWTTREFRGYDASKEYKRAALAVAQMGGVT